METSLRFYDNPWTIGESFFNPQWLAKYETIFAQGNGYMGVRTATEERYIGEKRNTFVAGTFNQFDETEVTELPNVPDVTHIKISIDGEVLDLTLGEVSQYERKLNLKNGEVVRKFVWTTPKGKKVKFEFKRFVSMDQKHILGQKMIMIPLNFSGKIELFSGIDGQQTNSGSQHFRDGKKRLYKNFILQLNAQTINSKIDFILNTAHIFYKNNRKIKPETRIDMPRRSIANYYWVKLNKNDELIVEKISNVHTSRDKEHINKTVNEISLNSINEIENATDKGYDFLFQKSSEAWNEVIWSVAPITVDSKNVKDQLSINFAKYHLHVSTPGHDNRMNIGAKGLTGEGYKGHTFWDTEIFILPYFIYTHPNIAKSLVEYRYNSLQAAKVNAQKNGYNGAQYPWESAWISDGETTPLWGAADVITGEPTPIWTGVEEHHITSDVAYGLYHYYLATKDIELMENKGFEIILETALFWTTRAEFDETKNKYFIKNVIGPDEYKEHIDNNAYTNYMAAWNMQKALQIIDFIKERPDKYTFLKEQFDFETLEVEIEKVLDKFYLPQPNNLGIIPQDDTYLSKESIDLSKYKDQDFVGGLFHEYNMEQVNDLQISKQADVVLLLYLLGENFSDEEKVKNFEYYEPRTMHDSSLSLASHAVIATDIERMDLSYDLFRRATEIDLGFAMNSSDEGIHCASLGGLWQAVIFGFGGIRNLNGKLQIEPTLPSEWNKLSYSIFWEGVEIKVSIAENVMKIENKSHDGAVEFYHKDRLYVLGKEEIEIKL